MLCENLKVLQGCTRVQAKLSQVRQLMHKYWHRPSDHPYLVEAIISAAVGSVIGLYSRLNKSSNLFVQKLGYALWLDPLQGHLLTVCILLLFGLFVRV